VGHQRRPRHDRQRPARALTEPPVPHLSPRSRRGHRSICSADSSRWSARIPQPHKWHERRLRRRRCRGTARGLDGHTIAVIRTNVDRRAGPGQAGGPGGGRVGASVG
jgi:hypothetical protein